MRGFFFAVISLVLQWQVFSCRVSRSYFKLLSRYEILGTQMSFVYTSVIKGSIS